MFRGPLLHCFDHCGPSSLFLLRAKALCRVFHMVNPTLIFCRHKVYLSNFNSKVQSSAKLLPSWELVCTIQIIRDTFWAIF